MYKVRFINRRNHKKVFTKTFKSIEDLVKYMVKIYNSRRICPVCIYHDIGKSAWDAFIRKFESYGVAELKRLGKYPITSFN